MVSLFGGDSGVDLGTAYAKIRVDLNELQSDMRSAQRIFGDGLRNIGPSISDLGQKISNLGSNLTILGAPLLAAGGIGLRTAADFEVLTRQISVFGGVAGEQLEAVRSFALKMGADTMFSASDAAAGLLDMLKAGMSVEEAMASLEATLNLATAGEVSLAQASGIVTSAMAQFNLAATDSSFIADTLARGANASRADVAGLGDALANVGPIAAQFGLDFEDTVSVLSLFSQYGIEGSDAGTKLRAVLNGLFSDAKPTKDALAELGVTLYDANGATRDFNDILLDLNAALADKTAEERNRIMLQLTDTFGLAGLNALLAAGGIGDMKAAMAGSADAAEVAEGFMGSLKGTVEELMGSLETLQINVITPMIQNTITPFVARMVELVNRVNDWALANPELAQSIAKVAGVVAMLGPALIGIGKAISLIGGLLNPAGLIITGLTLLYSAFETNFLGIRDLLGPVIETISEGIGAIVDAISFFIGDIQNFGLEEAILGIFGRGSLPETMESTLEGVLVSFGMTRDAAVAFVDDLYDTFTRIGNFIQNNVLPPLQTFADWFTQDALPAVVGFVTGTVVPAIQNFFAFLGRAWEVVGPALGSIFTWFTQTALPAVVEFIETSVRPTIDNLGKLIGGLWAVVSPALGSLLEWFQTTGLPIVQRAIDDVMNNFITPFINLIEAIWERIQPPLQDVFNWFTEEGLPAIGTALDDALNNFVLPLINTLADIWHTISEAVGSVLNWFTTTGLPLIDTALSNTKIMFIDPLITALTNIWEAVRPGVEALRDGINGALGWIDQNVIGPIRDGIYELQRIIAQITGQPLPAPPGASPPAPGTYNNGNVGTGGGFGTPHPSLLPVPGDIVRGGGYSGYRDVGGPGLAGALYMLRTPATPEAYFVPPADGQFIPNFDQVLASMAGGGNGAPVFQNVVVNANNAREGREAADAFMDRIEERYRERA